MWLPKLVCTNETIWNKTNILNVPITQSFKLLGFCLGASQGFFFFLHNAGFEGLLLQKLYFIKRVCVFMWITGPIESFLCSFRAGREGELISGYK